VQTTLLGLAVALIVALVSALVAPLVVDWNRYRGAFEAEASRLTGLAVHVNGGIDARILPTPHIKLHDVTIGEPGQPPQLQAAFVDLDVALGPLLQGELQATQLRLVAPRISLGLTSSGTIDWPAKSQSLHPDALTISRFTVEDGRVTLSDAASGSRLVLDKLDFSGDVRSFAGPFRGEGAFVVRGEPYAYRISGGRVDEDGGLKLKLGVEPTNYPLTTDLDGTLRFDAGAPQFDGTLSAARPVGVTLPNGERVMSDPWQLAGKVHATAASASLEDLALQYGPDERAVNFAGKAKLTFGAHPRLDGTVSAVEVDIDRMLAAPDVTHRPPFVLLKSFFEAFVGAVKPPLPLAAGITVNAVTVGGATIQSLHGDVGFDAAGWSLKNFAFHAPGFTDINLSGRLDSSPQHLGFSGPVRIESADLKTLTAWLEGRADQPPGPTRALTAHGDITIAGDRLAFDHLAATLDRENVEGRLAYTWGAAGRPAALDGELHAAKLDVDALLAFAKAAASDDAFEIPHKVALVLDVGNATLAGIDARMVDARLNFDAGIIHIDRLSIGDLGGAALNVSGRIDELSSRPLGQLTLDLDATTLAGVTELVGKFAPQVAAAVRPFVDRLAPAKVHGVLTLDRAGAADSRAKLDLSGDLGALRVALNGAAIGEPAHPGAAAMRITSRFDADDGGAILRLLDLDRVIAVDQLPGQMTISVNGPLDGDLQINGLASAGGFSAAAQGTLHLAGEQAPSGSLQLKASAADLRPLRRALTGQPGTATLVSASAIIGVAGADLSVTDLVVAAAKSSIRGRLDLKLSNPLGIAGDLSASNFDATAALATLLGLPDATPGAGRRWSSAPIGPGVFAALKGDVAVRLNDAALTPALVAHDLKGVVHFEPPGIVLRDIDGSLAGGRLDGELVLRRDAEKFTGQGHIDLVGANAGSLLAADKNAVDGAVTVKLQGETIGVSTDTVIGGLHGAGTITLTNGRFRGFDPAAFDAAIRAADQTGPIETAKQLGLKQLGQVVSAAMDKGRLAVLEGKADVTMTGGQIRLANANLQTQSGAVLSLQGILDLNDTSIDARMVLSGQPPANAMIGMRPELAVTLKGPLAAPERRLDVSTLLGWLTLRATEQQTRRIEAIEANRREDVLSPALRPTPPSVRIIPQGTELEITNRSSALLALSDARELDRLRPEVSATAADGRSGAAGPLPAAVRPAAARPAPDRATAATGTAPAPPRPATRSPLDLLFHSQN
jgi:large subunit ribosomal protein L24